MSFFFGFFAVGRLIMHNWAIGFPKLAFNLIAWAIVIWTGKKCRNEDGMEDELSKYKLIKNITSLLITIWWLVDVILFGVNQPTDAQGFNACGPW